MAMSLFGKKPNEKEASAPSKGARDPKGDLTTTTMDLTHLGAPGDVGRALAAAAGKIKVTESSQEEHAAIEEAAILYANASEDGARAVLEAAIDGALGKASEELWSMLFDLYRLTGNRTAFDARSEAYSKTFEISPPVWDASTPSPTPERRAAGSAPSVNLSGNLSGNARSQFEQLVRIGLKMGSLRIELGRIKGIDDSGCALLMETVEALKKAKAKLVLAGSAHALSLVEPKLVIGEKSNQAYWLLALSLIQQMANAEKFDEVALNYAITFEESPPAYEAPPAAPVEEAAPEPVAAEPEAAVDRFPMTGVIAGNQPEAFRQLAVYASQRTRIEIDASQTRRIEFVSAGSLFNQLAQLQGQGKLTVIHHPNALVAALLRVMGVDQVATIERRKTA
ncbi:STAS domain-containing protein [Viridibacterium curvum]|uniref:STAS domain-containing protein n=1 Tax=Viridibacterium curvum TaxID=1101404 RepID=A0ABP9QMB6_9RHOO